MGTHRAGSHRLPSCGGGCDFGLFFDLALHKIKESRNTCRSRESGPSPIPPVVQQPAPKPPGTVAAVIPPPTPPPTFTSAACSPEKAAFYDDFHKTDVSWNITIGEQAHYADGQLVVTPAPGKFYAPKYLSFAVRKRDDLRAYQVAVEGTGKRRLGRRHLLG